MAYTRVWSESDPADADQAKFGAQEIRELKADIRERMESLVTDWDSDPVLLDGTKVFAAGTKMVFFQAAAPTGWTKDVTQNDKALRVVSGSGGGSGGTLALSSATVGDHTLTISEMPAHAHTIDWKDGDGSSATINAGATASGTMNSNSTGGSGAHNHPLALAYIDVIVCTKD